MNFNGMVIGYVRNFGCRVAVFALFVLGEPSGRIHHFPKAKTIFALKIIIKYNSPIAQSNIEDWECIEKLLPPQGKKGGKQSLDYSFG